MENTAVSRVSADRFVRMQNVAYFATVQELLLQGKQVKIPVVGGSMRPFLRSGDTVLLRDFSPEDLQWGRIVLADSSYGYVLHRIVGWDQHYVRLAGDGNVAQIEHVERDRIIAIVIEAYRKEIKLKVYTKFAIFASKCWFWVRPLRYAWNGLIKKKL